eukprot:Gb_02436 [translate_table: standard]
MMAKDGLPLTLKTRETQYHGMNSGLVGSYCQEWALLDKNGLCLTLKINNRNPTRSHAGSKS